MAAGISVQIREQVLCSGMACPVTIEIFLIPDESSFKEI
jgi:hypothetical protein